MKKHPWPKPLYVAKPFLCLAAGLATQIGIEHWASGISTASFIWAGALILNWRGWLV